MLGAEAENSHFVRRFLFKKLTSVVFDAIINR